MVKCWIQECKRRVTVSCACNSNKIFCCKQHLHNHIIENLSKCNHDIENIFVKIPKEKHQSTLESSLASIRSIKALKKSMKSCASELINQINVSCNLMIAKLSKLEKQFAEVSMNAIRKKKCNKNFLLEYLDLYILDCSETLFKQLQNILTQVRNAFDVNLSTSKCIPKARKPMYNDIFFCSNNNTKFNSINLDLMKNSILEFAPMSFRRFQSCRIDEDIFFVNGGESSNKTYLIDFGKKTYDEYPCSETIDSAACILKDNIVHIFGGQTISRIISNCNGFDIKLGKWVTLPSLPESSVSNTASILRDEIIVSGYNLSALYEYKSNTFTEILINLNSNMRKVVCKGWVIIENGVVYENTVDSQTWTTHNCNFKFTTNCRSSVFYKEEFIYWVDHYGYLKRFNTKMKKMNEVAYS